MNKFSGAIPIALISVLLSGCPSKPIQETTPPPAVTVPAPTVRLPVAPEPRGYRPEDLNDPKSPLYQRVVYFEYDSSDIRPQFIEILRAHASYLARNPTARVTLDGHTDERGTREYNLALGDERANKVKRFLVAERAPDTLIRTMSYGEERPAEPGHDETAWELNRRVELVY